MRFSLEESVACWGLTLQIVIIGTRDVSLLKLIIYTR